MTARYYRQDVEDEIIKAKDRLYKQWDKPTTVHKMVCNGIELMTNEMIWANRNGRLCGNPNRVKK